MSAPPKVKKARAQEEGEEDMKSRSDRMKIDRLPEIAKPPKAEPENKLSLAYVAKQYGVDARLVYGRLKKGWSIERALTEPSRTVAAAPALERVAKDRDLSVEALVANLLKAAEKRKSAQGGRKEA